jgi:hypothetical protein
MLNLCYIGGLERNGEIRLAVELVLGPELGARDSEYIRRVKKEAEKLHDWEDRKIVPV